MFGNIGDMMGKLQEMKQKTEEVKAKLEKQFIKVEGAGGDIIVEINGNRVIKQITVSPALQHGDKEELEEQLVVAINKALEKAETLNDSEMKTVAGSMLPGLF
jgi:nucleoid-associated protein EbfC